MLVPLGHHPRHPVAQVAAVAAEEIEQVAHLQRDDVVRIIDQDIVQPLRGAVEGAVDQAGDGGGVAALAVIELEAAQLGQQFRGVRHRPALHAGQQQIRLERDRHREIGTLGDRVVDRGDRVAHIAIELADRGFIDLDRPRVGAAQRRAAMILHDHGPSPSPGRAHRAASHQ